MRKRLLWAVVVLGLGLALAACGGGGEEAPGRTPAAQTPPAEAVTTPEEGEEAVGDLQELRRTLQEISQRWQELAAKFVYRLRSESDGETTEGTLTLYWDAPNWRLDLRFPDSQGTLIHRDGESLFCTAENRICLKMDLAQAPLPPVPGFFVADPSQLPSFIEEQIVEQAARAQGVSLDIERSRRTIAGQDAQCFSARWEEAGQRYAGEICWSEDGLLLLVRGEGPDGSFSLEAQEVGKVSAQDFEPPYPVQELPFGIPTPPR